MQWRWSPVLLLISVLLTMSLSVGSGSAQEKRQARYFSETGHSIGGEFLAYWEQFGGLPVFGYPLTEEFQENGHTVQYFERARFEWHPGAWPQRYDVLLGRLGVAVAEQTGFVFDGPLVPAPRKPDCAYLQGRNLCGNFRDYWEAFGGLALFGYPLTEAYKDPITALTVQYFERARFELHPGTAPDRHDVLLGLVGTEYLYGPPAYRMR